MWSLCPCCLDCLEDVHSSFNFDSLNFCHTSDEYTTARHAIAKGIEQYRHRGVLNVHPPTHTHSHGNCTPHPHPQPHTQTPYTHTHRHTHTDTDTHSHTQTHTHTHTHTLQHTCTHTCKHTLAHASLTYSHMTIRGAFVSFCFFSTSPIILSREPIGGRPSFGQERKWKRVTSRGDSVLCKEQYVKERI